MYIIRQGSMVLESYIEYESKVLVFWFNEKGGKCYEPLLMYDREYAYSLAELLNASVVELVEK
jgi:hypothetical protein